MPRKSAADNFPSIFLEDNLAAQQILANEPQAQDGAVQGSAAIFGGDHESISIWNRQLPECHRSADNRATNQRTAVDILGRRLNASVLLVKALGGGWKVA